MASNGEAAKVAIYWDFENLHAVLTDQENGPDYYREHRMMVQVPVADVVPVIDYAASLGDLIINRAYGNWQFFSRYRDQLNSAGIDLIQMFPRGANMKNSADIRMALDALDDLHTHPHLTHIVVVSSDSDFISLAQKVKQAGKFIAGVGVEKNSNRFWVASCNEFRFYSSLVKLSETSELAMTAPAATPDMTPAPVSLTPEAAAVVPPSQTGPGTGPVAELPNLLGVDAAREALVKSLTQLVARQGENYVHRSTLKSVMKRHMPAFDERALGWNSFTSFLEQFPDIVKIVDAEGGGHVAWVDVASDGSAPVAP